MTLWTLARQTPLSVGFSRQLHCSGLLFPPPEDLPDPGVEPVSPASSALVGGFFTPAPPGNPKRNVRDVIKGLEITLRLS